MLRVLCLVVAGLLVSGCQPRGVEASAPYVGNWRMKSGANWVFNANGTCAINGQPGRWREANGVLEVTRADRPRPMRLVWTVADGGKRLLLTTRSRAYTAAFERQ